MPEGRVLIVDDNLDLADVVAELLGAQGYEVQIAEDGERGLEMMMARAPDVVLLDVEMPRLDGPETAYRMHIHDAGLEKIPIVLSSGVVGLREVARRVGTPYYIGKPFETSSMLALVRRALDERLPPAPGGTRDHRPHRGEPSGSPPPRP